jgi:hypothetical protein
LLFGGGVGSVALLGLSGWLAATNGLFEEGTLPAAAIGGILAIFAIAAAGALRRLVRDGPSRVVFQFTSTAMGASSDLQLLSDGCAAMRVESVLAIRRKSLLRWNPERLLRVNLSNRVPFDIPWRGSDGDLHQLVEELSSALGLAEG